MSGIESGGIVLTLLAGVCSGNSMLPMKFARRWQWENVWLVFSIVSLVILPWTLAFFLGGDLGRLYGGLHPGQLLLPLLLGAGWGVAQVLFGLSVVRLGMALGFAIIIGLGSIGGTLVPLFLKHGAVLGTPSGVLILVGLGIMVAGIAFAAHAGSQRETRETRNSGSGYATALALAILCGILAPMINYSFAFGQDIAARAVACGVSPVRAAYTVWPVTLAGGLLPNLMYSFYLLSRKRTWRLFRGPWLPDVGLASLMAIFWMGSMSLYGMASVYLGALGTSVGWGLFQIFMIITANLGGLVTGEWTTASKSARRSLYAGLLLLITATITLSVANR
jgi:L-rhamnose-H+ transport protein